MKQPPHAASAAALDGPTLPRRQPERLRRQRRYRTRGFAAPVGQTLGPRLAFGWSEVGRQDGLGPQRGEVIKQSLCVTVGIVQVRPPSDKLVGDCLEDGEGGISVAGVKVGARLLGELEDTIRRFAEVVARSQKTAHLPTYRGHGRGCCPPCAGLPNAWLMKQVP